MSEEDSTEKEFEASQRKLEEQRRKGEVPRSTDINTAAAYLGLLIAAVALGQSGITRLGELGTVLLQQADSLSALAAQGARPVIGTVIADTVLASLPLFALPFALVWAALFAQRAVIFAPEKLHPKLSRISPDLERAKQVRAGRLVRIRQEHRQTGGHLCGAVGVPVARIAQYSAQPVSDPGARLDRADADGPALFAAGFRAVHAYRRDRFFSGNAQSICARTACRTRKCATT